MFHFDGFSEGSGTELRHGCFATVDGALAWVGMLRVFEESNDDGPRPMEKDGLRVFVRRGGTFELARTLFGVELGAGKREADLLARWRARIGGPQARLGMRPGEKLTRTARCDGGEGTAFIVGAASIAGRGPAYRLVGSLSLTRAGAAARAQGQPVIELRPIEP
jgi:hypothetical protein